MKRFVATAIAAGALVAGPAAMAQDLGAVIGNLLGLGLQLENNDYGPGDRYVLIDGQSRRLHADAYGRQFYVNEHGQQVYLGNQAQVYNNAPQITGYDQYGRPLYGGQYAYGTRSWDRDGDGVSNRRDRYPDDPRWR